MSTLQLHAPHVSEVRLSFVRVGAAIVTVLDVFAEAKLRALAAHKRLSVH